VQERGATLHRRRISPTAAGGRNRYHPRGSSHTAPLAIALAGGPLIAFLDNLWFVPAFLYVIAVLHLWLACLHETRGRLQYRSASRHAKEELQ